MTSPPAPPALQVGPLTLDPAGYVATLDGRPVRLTAGQFELLYALAANPGTIYSPEQVYRIMRGGPAADPWGRPVIPNPRTVRSRMHRLGRKLGGHASLIASVRGRGYMIAFPVRQVASTAATETRTDHRSPEGVTVDLINGLIAIARVLRSRPMATAAEREALADLRADADVRWLLGVDAGDAP